MLIGVANYFDADRRSALAGEDLPLGAVCAVTTNAAGDRVMTKVAAGGDLKVGAYALALKVSADPLQVDVSSVPVELLGSRIVAISSGDAIVECRRGTIMSYDPSLLDASLDPARGGTLPSGTDALAIKNGLPCSVGASGAITTPVVLKYYNTVGGKINIELV